MSTLGSKGDAPRVQWPYKHLWNLLRGESILADDEVILEELRLAYEQIVLGLTQYKLRESDLTEESPSSSTPTAKSSTTVAAGDKDKGTDQSGEKDKTLASASEPASAPPTTPKDEKENEKKLRKRISICLDLEESVSWQLFCSYMMFEYKGGSTSFEKLLEAPRISTEFLTDLKVYYLNERVSVLLCIQALFGHHGDNSHKHNLIFRAFGEWADDHGISDLTENLLKSLEFAKNDDEEVQTLHALTLLVHQMPHLALKPFVASFKGFLPGRKDLALQAAEAALIYSVLLLPNFDEEWPDSIPPLIKQLITKHGEDFLLNKFSVGAVIAAYTNMCQGDRQMQKVLTTSPFPSATCLPAITELAHIYSDPPFVQHRHNLPTVVLKSLYYAVKAIFEKLDQAIPRLGSRSDFYEFLIVALKHKEIAIKFLTTTQDLMELVTDATMTFPLNVKHTLEMWSSMCTTAEREEDACGLLEDCTKVVTCVCGFARDSALVTEGGGVYKSRDDSNVCGVRVPAGTEAILSDDLTTVTWDLKIPLSNNVWTILYTTVIRPVIDQIQRDGVGLNHNARLLPLLCEGQEGDNIRALFSFLKRFAKVSNAAPIQLLDLYEPASFILIKAMEQAFTMEGKATLVADLVELVAGSEKLSSAGWTSSYIRSIWPACGVDPPTIVSQLIMGYESVAANQCKVTLSFLDATLACFHDREYGDRPAVDNIMRAKLEAALNAVHFINENVFHSFTRWRMESQELKCKVLLRCLRIYNAVFRLEDSSPEWITLRAMCAQSLLASNSSLMAAFNTDDEQLQNSVIKPTLSNYLMPEIIYESLALLLSLFKFQKETIQLVDASLGSTLVQKLGRFARHRLDYKIPTLAMALLKKIAEELDMSLLSCFGSDEIAFRDLILQRLEFRSEDVNLKVAILDFLTVAAFKQPGLIQYIFMDDFLAEKIVDLPTEKDEGLALSVLTFLRALVQKGASVIKKCKNLWTNAFTPIRNFQGSGRLRVITATLQIATIELFRNGMSDVKFAAEVKWLLKESVFLRLYEILLSVEGYSIGEDGVKCLRAFNHFMSVVLRRNDMHDIFEEKTKLSMMNAVSKALFRDQDLDYYQARILLYVEAVTLLVNAIPTDEDFLASFSQYLLRLFEGQSLSVRISLLCLTNELMVQQTEEVHASTTENIIRTMFDLFDKVMQGLRQKPLQPNHTPIIMLAATVINTMISKGDKIFPRWLEIFENRMLASVIILVINQAMRWLENADVVCHLLLILRSLSDVKDGAKLLQYSDITSGLLIPIFKYSENAVNGQEGPWGKVYVFAINLLSQMIYRQRFYYVEEALTVWGVHGNVIWKQLMSLSNMSQDCISIRNPESNFKRMRNLLTFNLVSLDAIHAMLPFRQHWKQVAPENYHQLMVSVFGSLQTAINLLEQPTYLYTVINSISASPARSPHITELQAKLWEVVSICTHILWTVRSHMLDFVVVDQLRLTVNQVTQACIKALSKGPHKSTPTGARESSVSQFPTASSRTVVTLERSLALIHFMATSFFADSSAIPLVQKRLLATDVTMMVDGVKRVSGYTSDPNFCMELMNALEELIKLNKVMVFPRQSKNDCDFVKEISMPGKLSIVRAAKKNNENEYVIAARKVVWVPAQMPESSRSNENTVEEVLRGNSNRNNTLRRPVPMRCMILDENGRIIHKRKADVTTESLTNVDKFVPLKCSTPTVTSNSASDTICDRPRPSNIPRRGYY